MASSQPCSQHAHTQAWPERDMTIWNQNRETIHRLFLLENRTLAQVKHVLESEHGFPEFRLIDYEVVLREHLGFRKNLKKEDWLAIEYHREQRRQKGKASNVYLQGLLMEKPRVDRAVRRSKNDRNLPYRSRRERAHPLPEGITMRTPSPVLPSRDEAPGMSIINTTITTNILSIQTLGQSVYQVAPGLDMLPMNTGMAQRQRHVQVSVEEMRLHLPFNKFAETIKPHYNMDASTSPSPAYTGVRHPSIGSVQLPEHSNIRINYEALGGSHQNGTAKQTIMTKERRHDRLTTRNIAFVGGKFEFDKLMRVFFVLSNKQMIHEHEGVEIIEWIESADLGVLRGLFSLPLSTVAAAWEQLILISNVLKCQKAFSKLLEIGLVIHGGQWLEENAGDVLGIAIWLGLRDWVKRLLKNGLSPRGPLKQARMTPFLGYTKSIHHPYNLESPSVPLQVAFLRLDAETVADLLYSGATAELYNIDIISRTLLGRSTDEDQHNTLRCLKVLLDEGVDVDLETSWEMLFSRLQKQSSFHRLGWLPKRANYLSDLLWYHFADKTSLRVAFDLVSKNSKRINDSLTVPGLYDAASCGCSKLLQYLNSRTTPSGSDRSLLLEITLSQAALRGDLNVSQTLIQMGVDPNVQEIFSQTSQRETWRYHSEEIHFDLADQWVPVFQASQNRDKALLQILFNAGVDCNQHNLLDALLSEGEEQWTNLCAGGHSNVQAVRDTVENGRPLAPEAVNDMYKFFLTAGFDIGIHGNLAMTRAVMRWGKSEPEAASLQCDWLHSKGVDWDAEFEGRNLVHCAVKWGCGLDLIRFLVARGVKVHSSPCNEETTMLYDALYDALYEEHSLEVINFLLHQGASVHDQSYGGLSILQPVLFRDWTRPRPTSPATLSICRRLIEAGATIFSPPQQQSWRFKSPSRLLAALITHPGIEDDLIFGLLESNESIDLCYDPCCLSEPYVQSPMEAAIKSGRLNIARKLLQRGSNEQEASLILSMALNRCTKLCVSLPENRAALDFMMFLIKSGADMEELGAQGLNPLHHAAEEGSLNIAGVLLENGANPNVTVRRVMIGVSEHSSRPLTDQMLFMYRHPSKGDFGLDEEIAYDQHGCPHFMEENHGPLLAPRSLDLAAYHGRLDMVQLLLNAGAISGHPDITPYDGAIKSAQFNGHHTIVRLLTDAAAQIMSPEVLF